MIAVVVCVLIGAAPGVDRRVRGRALIRRHARRLPGLAGRDPQRFAVGAPIIIEDRWINYTRTTPSPRGLGWVIAAIISAVYVRCGALRRGSASAGSGSRSAIPTSSSRSCVGVASRYLRSSSRSATTTAGTHLLATAGVLIIFFLLLLTFLAKRTTFGRHVYAVGGNAGGARRAGINVPPDPDPRLHDLGGDGRRSAASSSPRTSTRSTSPPGGGTLLLDAIAAAVIGGVSLFGGRG